MSKIKSEVANRRIKSFEKRFGQAHLCLAYHAAFPLALTPDLLYRLWANFQRDIHGEVLSIPWVAVADMLLSNLCDEVGYELYEMDLAVKKELLRCLKENPNFGQQRLDELAKFLLDYIHQQLHSDDPDIQDLAQSQRWTALAYVLPSEAARELALTLSKLDQTQDKSELVRLASLVDTVAEPLAEFEPLLIYTRGMASFVRGDLDSAVNQFSTLPIHKNQIQFAGISLHVPEQIIKVIRGVQGTVVNRRSRSANQTITSWILKVFSRQPPSTQTSYRQEIANNLQTPPGRLNSNTLVIVSVTITALVCGVRFLGLLQTLELRVYDQMMRSRPDEGMDQRLLVVTIDDQDLANQRQNGEDLKGTPPSDKSLNKANQRQNGEDLKGTLLSDKSLNKANQRQNGEDLKGTPPSDKSLNKANQRQNGEDLKGTSLSDKSLNILLARFEEYKPRAIGLDIYRDFSAEQADLSSRLQQTQNLIGVCKGSDATAKTKGIKPPPEIPKQNLGFSDFINDNDGVVRRHLLFMTQEAASLCSAPYALSTQLAYRYLSNKGFRPSFTPEGNLQLGNTVFSSLESRTGGYQIEANGQILLNYRSSKQIAEQVTLTEFLAGQVNPNAIKDRIVLIGVTAKGDSPDTWSTPYGTFLDQQMPGVLVQAQMVSQILSAVLDKRPLLWFWPQWVEVVWIGCWSLLGGVLARRFKHPLSLGLANAIATVVLYVFCFTLLIRGGWIPFIPPVLALVVAGTGVMFLEFQPQLARQRSEKSGKNN